MTFPPQAPSFFYGENFLAIKGQVHPLVTLGSDADIKVTILFTFFFLL